MGRSKNSQDFAIYEMKSSQIVKMQNKLNSPNLPSKQKFAGVFRLLGQISYWIHLILGATSAIILGLIVFSRRLGTTANNTAISISIALTIASLVALGIRIFFRLALQPYGKKPTVSNTLAAKSSRDY